MSDNPALLEGFGGVARLFPLPNLVLFPRAIQPLHIFEPRYRQMMADALDGDRLLALALLRPGWEEDYHQAPAIHPVVCVGRIYQEERLPDGRYNLLLHGVARARVREELATDRLYRTARVDLLPDAPLLDEDRAAELRGQLGEGACGWFGSQSAALAQLRKLVEGPLELGALCDVFSFALPLGLEDKQALLEEPDVERRARRLIELLSARQPGPGGDGRAFPPEFSDN